MNLYNVYYEYSTNIYEHPINNVPLVSFLNNFLSVGENKCKVPFFFLTFIECMRVDLFNI